MACEWRWRAGISFGVLVLTMTLAANGVASAQATGYDISGTAGLGTVGDDEGWLGSGLAAGVAIGRTLGNRWRLEGAVHTADHEQVGSISWEGRMTAFTGRALLRFGSPAAAARAFVGVGAGLGRYSGTRSDTVFPAVVGGPGQVEPRPLRVTGGVFEYGAGVEINTGRRFYLRPEGWISGMTGTRTNGLEPPIFMPKLAVTLGVRF